MLRMRSFGSRPTSLESLLLHGGIAELRLRLCRPKKPRHAATEAPTPDMLPERGSNGSTGWADKYDEMRVITRRVIDTQGAA